LGSIADGNVAHSEGNIRTGHDQVEEVMDICGAIQCVLPWFLDWLNDCSSGGTGSWGNPEVEVTEHEDTCRDVPGLRDETDSGESGVVVVNIVDDMVDELLWCISHISLGEKNVVT